MVALDKLKKNLTIKKGLKMEKTERKNLTTNDATQKKDEGTLYPVIKERKLNLVNIARNDFARYSSRRYGRVDIQRYTFRYNSIDLAEALKHCTKENMNISKAIGIGLNYIRTMEKEKAMKLIEKTYNELKNRQTKRNNETTIAMTKNNWEYLNTFNSKLKYPLIIAASRLSKIYNPKKDQFK